MTENKSEKSFLWKGLGMVWQLGYTIAIPLTILALLGRWLDKKLDSSPLLLLVGILLSVIVSSIGVWRKIAQLTKELEELAPSKPKKDK